MKDVLAIITPAYANAFGEAANYAFVLAGLFEAHVTVLITEIEPDAPAPMSAPDLMQGGGEVAGPTSTNEGVARTMELVQGAARRVNAACTVLSEPRSAEQREILIGTAQVRDIVTIDVRGPLRHPRQSLVEVCYSGVVTRSSSCRRAFIRQQRKEPSSPGTARGRRLGPCTILCRY